MLAWINTARGWIADGSLELHLSKHHREAEIREWGTFAYMGSAGFFAARSWMRERAPWNTSTMIKLWWKYFLYCFSLKYHPLAGSRLVTSASRSREWVLQLSPDFGFSRHQHPISPSWQTQAMMCYVNSPHVLNFESSDGGLARIV